ncbi:AAA family ATPase [Kitasatospora sp. NBC_00240]|uniref:helix-turn-helix transcriptional regulator n=1 Tax=Kitasatospora sp. NBC_00240 TaxID=2903567 RepID=UPI00225A70FB|nr:LuxR family transcriptional regulator [Kitasatospora sp. NBC_00240]MCX5215468.1 AAA family ATPase [Kitasatospora sp. NBC_00240]
MADTGTTLETATRLFGRDQELAELGRLRDTTQGGCGQSVLVQGEAGIGKTALFETFAAQCRSAHVRVLYSAANELERRVPFQALLDCLSSSADDAARDQISSLRASLRGDAGSTPLHREFTVAENVQALLEDWCADGPVVMLLDDAQWADDFSLAVLGRLQRALHHLPVLLGLTLPSARRTDRPEMLQGFEDGAARTLHLSPLGQEDVSRLAGELLESRPGPVLLDRLTAAGGNPLFVIEMVRAFNTYGEIHAAGDCTDVDATTDVDSAAGDARNATTGIPEVVAEVILRSLEAFPPSAREALRTAAVLGPRVDLWELSLILGQPVTKVWEAFAEAVDGGVLENRRDSLSFRHGVVRQLLVAGVTPSVRSALRRQAGQALAAAGAPPERAAEYLLRGGGSLAPQSLAWLSAVVHALGMRAPLVAAELLERALESVGSDATLASTFRAELAAVLLRLGEPGRAMDLARTALASGCLPVEEAELRWVLAQSAYQQHHYETAVEEARKALEHAPDDARFEALTAQCNLALRRFDDVESAARRTVAAGLRGDLYVAAHGVAVQALSSLASLHPTEALELADRAATMLGNQHIRPELPIAPHFIRGLALIELDRVDEAHQAFDRGLRHTGPGGCPLLTWYHLGKARLGFIEGRWDDALAEVNAGRETVDPLGMGGALSSQAALIAVHRGDPGTYAELMEHPDDSIGGSYYEFLRRWARALTWEAQGKPEKALDLLFEMWQSGAGGVGQPFLYRLCADALRLAADLEDTDRLRRLTAVLTAGAGTRPSNARGTALLGVGLLRGEADVLRDSADCFRTTGHVLNEAYAFECAARVLGRRGEAGPARQTLHRALELYERLDARWDALRAEEALAALGIRSRRRVEEQPRTGWPALTETERTIVRHVADGRSNPDIGTRMYLSPRTVQFHLSAVFAKLGVASRVELAVQAHRRPANEMAQDAKVAAELLPK